MSSVHKPLNCLICKKQMAMMVALDQTLNLCESLTVAQVLESLQFLTIPELKRLGAVLCFICVAKVQSCFDFKTQCYLVEKELEIQSAFSGPSEVASVLSLDDMPINTINDDALEENCIANDNHSKSCEISDVKDQVNVEDIENILTNMKYVVQETNTKDNCEIKSEIEIVENILKIENVNSNEQKGKRKTFPCDICYKSFPFFSNLMKHKRTHSTERPYPCDVCNKYFKCPANVVVHRRIHTGERPFVCKVCNKAFLYSTSLDIHKRGHTGERPFHCHVCKKSFISSAKLKEHFLIHTKEKPHVCDICNRAFSLSSYLKRHRVLHSKLKAKKK